MDRRCKFETEPTALLALDRAADYGPKHRLADGRTPVQSLVPRVTTGPARPLHEPLRP